MQSELLEAIRRCRLCRDTPDGPVLPHEPNPVLVLSGTARILIASQAPGTRAHAGGRPFIDGSGLRLRAWMGVEEAEFYDDSRIGIVPMGFCFPGQDRHGGDLPPRRECRAAWHDRVFTTTPAADLILAVGSHAQAYHYRRLGHRLGATLTDTVKAWCEGVGREGLEGEGLGREGMGRQDLWLETPGRDRGPTVVPLPHPSWRNTAWLKSNPWFEAELVPVLQRLVRERLSRR